MTSSQKNMSIKRNSRSYNNQIILGLTVVTARFDDVMETWKKKKKEDLFFETVVLPTIHLFIQFTNLNSVFLREGWKLELTGTFS